MMKSSCYVDGLVQDSSISTDRYNLKDKYVVFIDI